MSREIDCPDCDGSGYGDSYRVPENTSTETNPLMKTVYPSCPNCTHGKIKVFIQTELNKAVQDEINSNIVELERLLEKEANEYADMEYIQGVEDCLKIIRARTK